ncbi:hypothetical protein [Halobaculum lipolyticum]|uniref:Sulfatase n=1 Tax=Halobaculum lipolyticum TaxID=3032001 RepID=A0ABD5WF44_9EURY|nr:hypothetical protein [Halobaculum sp. DT31]
MIRPATIRRGVTSVPGFVEEYGVAGGLRRWAGIVYHRATGEVSGRSVFSEPWDVCVILDACRADELERLSGSYDWLGPVGRFPSLASCTWNWVPETVAATPASTLRETEYVAANPFPEELTEPGTFAAVDPVYAYAWDDDRGTVLPRAVTDAAIRRWREGPPERLVVHYVQPHVPFLTEDASALGEENFSHDAESVRDAWDRVTAGELDRAVAVDRYRRTLETVLADVDLLLSSIDADRVVVTADHGEAFGESGLYGHPQGIDLPCLTRVPWVETSAADDGRYDPAERDRDAVEADATDEATTDAETRSRLRALGYRE